MSKKISKKDIKMYKLLRNDGRITLTDVSKHTKMPVSTIHDKLKSNSKGVIKNFTCLLDFDKLGFTNNAFILIKSRKDWKEKLTIYLNNHPNINTLIKINSGYDFLIEVYFMRMKQLESFLENIVFIYKASSHEVFFSIDELKRERFFIPS